MYFAIFLIAAILTPTTLALSDGNPITDAQYTTPYNFFVSIRYNEKHICGGIVVKDGFILTSAYCVQVLNKNLTVTYITTGGKESLNVDNVAPHKDFNYKTFENDIAILSVAKGKITTAIPLDACGTDTTTGTISALGIGVERVGGPLQELPPKKYDVREVTAAKCRTAYQHTRKVTDGMTCFDAGICSGDQGGPIFLEVAGNTPTFTLLGISSWSFGCGMGAYPSVATSICKFKDYITTNTA